MACLMTLFGWAFVTMASMEFLHDFSITVAHVWSPLLLHANVEEWMSVLACDVSDLVRHMWYAVCRFVVCPMPFSVCCMS